MIVREIVFDNKLLMMMNTTEPHIKRQETQHNCLPRLLGDGDKGIEIRKSVW
jgi:hypothetical protein